MTTNPNYIKQSKTLGKAHVTSHFQSQGVNLNKTHLLVNGNARPHSFSIRIFRIGQCPNLKVRDE